jgi:hypothetical protein
MYYLFYSWKRGKFWQEQHREGRTYSGSPLQGTAHHNREAMTEDHEVSDWWKLSPTFLPAILSRTQRQETITSLFPPQLTQSGDVTINTPRDWCPRCFWILSGWQCEPPQGGNSNWTEWKLINIFTCSKEEPSGPGRWISGRSISDELSSIPRTHTKARCGDPWPVSQMLGVGVMQNWGIAGV